MPRHILVVVFLTFLAGFATGLFLFFMSRSPGELDHEPVKTLPQKGFEVVAYTYGGCARLGCASYRIDDSGSYSYIARNAEGVDERFSDVISDQRLEDLKNLIDSTDMDDIANSHETGVCPTTYDGIAYRYEIRIKDERYSIDSCSEELDDSPLFKVLDDYFEIFSLTHRKPA